MDDENMEPMSHVRKQYKAFRTPARDDSVWEEGPHVGLIVASSVGPDFIEETERYLEHVRTTTPQKGGGIFDSLYFAQHHDVVEYVRPRSPGEFGEHEEDISPRFQHTRVTNLTRLVLLLQATSSGATEPAEIAHSMEVHRWAFVALKTSRLAS